MLMTSSLTASILMTLSLSAPKAGALYEETCTQFGMYNEGDWGCSSPVPRAHGASSNTYIRFHWTGALELSLMVLDLYDATGDVAELLKYVPMAEGTSSYILRALPKNKNKKGNAPTVQPLFKLQSLLFFLRERGTGR